MSLHPDHHHAPDADGCVARLKLLADGIRLGVVRELMRGPRHVGELATLLRAERSLLSHHLRILRDARIVIAERDGKSVLYRLADGVLAGRRARGALDLGCCRLSFD
ncbi:ArsR family transcriptional regulator [Salinisphaera sp. PC39]